MRHVVELGPRIAAALAEPGKSPADVARLILTHAHAHARARAHDDHARDAHRP